jgi:single-stranded DNA-binding protein
MSNSGVWFANLGKDPEELELGGKAVMKLRCAEKAGNKKAETRWFTALVGGPDVETAKRLAKGDSIALSGEMVLKSYKPKKPRYKGEVIMEDEISFAKLVKVIKSPTFFAEQEAPAEEGAPTADAPAGDAAPDLTGTEPPDLSDL